MRKSFWALVCLVSAMALVAGACSSRPRAAVNTPPTAVLLAAPTEGAPPLQVDFSAVLSSDAGGTIVAYAWDLGDGTLSDQVEFSHTYTVEGVYTVSLTVTDDKGATATETVDVTVAIPNDPPMAMIGSDVTSGVAPLVVSFTSSASDPDGTVASIEWDFGDGATSNEADPVHTYSSAGSYPVVLSVTDDRGATTSDSTVIEVIGNDAPTAPGSPRRTPTAPRATTRRP
jgi:PKD repeat protein